jgi:DnaJ like chaperone protein
MAVLADAAVAMVRRAAPLAREDVRCIREQLTLIFELDKEGLELLRQYLKRADAAPHPVSDIAVRFSHLIEDESEYPHVLHFLYNVAAVSGTVHPEKEAFILDLVRLIGIDERIHASVRTEFQTDIAQHFATLELPVTADFDEVRRAYRRLASDYHPDRVQTLPKGFQDYATQRFREIRTAYEALRKHFGT